MKQKQGKYWLELILIAFLIAIVIVTVISMFLFRKSITDATVLQKDDKRQIHKHYAFICTDKGDPMMEQAYEGMKQAALKSQADVEYFGKDLSVEYSISELLEVAVNAKVDGIIVVGEESSKLKEAISHAEERGIPVVTVFQDCSNSKRECFVGVNGYDLGVAYAKKLIEIREHRKQNVYILVNSSNEEAEQNTVFLAIKEALKKEKLTSEVELHVVSIKSKLEFSSEEVIRGLILDEKKKPDVLICLNSIDTSCAYEAVVDYDKVGQVKILGWDSSESTLMAIRKQIIDGCIGMDAKEMGTLCIKSLKEYEAGDLESTYIKVSTTMIDSTNVDSCEVKHKGE